MKRVDRLDIAFAAGGVVVGAGMLVALATSWDVGRIVAAPGAVTLLVILCFEAWWDEPRSAIAGAPHVLNRVLPWCVMFAGLVLAGSGVVRLIVADTDWFSRYVMGVVWGVAGLCGFCQGIARFCAPAAQPV